MQPFFRAVWKLAITHLELSARTKKKPFLRPLTNEIEGRRHSPPAEASFDVGSEERSIVCPWTRVCVCARRRMRGKNASCGPAGVYPFAPPAPFDAPIFDTRASDGEMACMNSPLCSSFLLPLFTLRWVDRRAPLASIPPEKGGRKEEKRSFPELPKRGWIAPCVCRGKGRGSMF